MKKIFSDLIVIGWREWVSFPEWGIDHLKVKVDTGARTSSLHVRDLKYFEKDSKPWVQFYVYPWQESTKNKVLVSTPVVSHRNVKSSSGCLEKRPVILAKLKISDQEIEIELTLTNRSTMGFRMLLGRAAMRNHFMVIAGKSYLGGRPSPEVRKKNRGVL